jgi:hypothetical protein
MLEKEKRLAKGQPHLCMKQNRKDGPPGRSHRIEGRPPAGPWFARARWPGRGRLVSLFWEAPLQGPDHY